MRGEHPPCAKGLGISRMQQPHQEQTGVHARLKTLTRTGEQKQEGESRKGVGTRTGGSRRRRRNIREDSRRMSRRARLVVSFWETATALLRIAVYSRRFSLPFTTASSHFRLPLLRLRQSAPRSRSRRQTPRCLSRCLAAGVLDFPGGSAKLG
eukprot:6162222-Pleurochrysis_carterae.AAC.1